MAPKNVTNSRPEAQQERGPDSHPRHANVKSEALNVQDFTTSASGPRELEPDAVESNEEGHGAPCRDNGSYECLLCKEKSLVC